MEYGEFYALKKLCSVANAPKNSPTKGGNGKPQASLFGC